MINLRSFVMLILFGYPYLLHAQQNKPEINPTAIATGNPKYNLLNLNPNSSSLPTLNYIRIWEPQVSMAVDPSTNSSLKQLLQYSVDEMHRMTQYFDGLSRPLQTVIWQMGSAKKDIVTTHTYDDFGREQYQYLPFTPVGNENISVVTGDGYFKYNASDQQKTFGLQQYPSEDFFYSHAVFENSPLSRTLAVYAPGKSWAGSEEASGITKRHTKTEYLLNVGTIDSVRVWDIPNTTNYDNNIPSTVSQPAGLYQTGALLKILITDENGNKVAEYKDKEGRIILKKVLIDPANATQGHYGWLCTYYVYDEMGFLRFIISPKAVEKMVPNALWAFTGASVNELCFHYEYDNKGRMIAKKIPGSAWVYMIYDERDRLVFTQDGNMRNKNQWMTTLYDDLNRPVLTGMFETSISRSTLISNMSNLNYTTSSLAFSTVSGISVHANPFPTLTGSYNFYPLTKTNYDDYTFDWTYPNYKNNLNNKLLPISTYNVEPENNPIEPSKQTKGMVTGVRVKVIENAGNLNTGEWLTTTSYFNEKGRVIQVNSDNYKGGSDITATLYDFTGKVLSSFLNHEIAPANEAPQEKGIATDMEYDHAGRLRKIRKRIFNALTADNPVQQNRIVDHTYDDLGQLVSKKLGQLRDPITHYYNSSDPIEQLDYEYNIRGWLRGINKDYAVPNGNNSRWFGMQLNYDKGFQQNQFNGNISGTTWRSKGNGERRAYGFGYDNANRLMFADFNQYSGSGGGNWSKGSMDFSLFMGDGSSYNKAYDANGNIKQMQQWSTVITSTGLSVDKIDDLIYSYDDDNNKLKAVTDASASANRMGDFFDKNKIGDFDYGYDANGNMVNDLNKKILSTSTQTGEKTGYSVDAEHSAIEYNFLNLPWKITMQKDDPQSSNLVKGVITYIYDALGNKLEKRIKENNAGLNNFDKNTTTTYIGAFVYEKVDVAGVVPAITKLQYILQEEGRIRQSSELATLYNYDYFVKDHLGNVRMVLTDEFKEEKAEATMESAENAKEDALFYNRLPYNKSSELWYPTDAHTLPNNYVVKLSGSNSANSIGPIRVLKVMSGDKLQANVNCTFKDTDQSTDSHRGWSSIANQLISVLFGTSSPAALADKPFLPSVIGNASFSNVSGFNTFFGNNNGSTGNTFNPSGKPKAYLNILLFDENFILDQTNSKVIFAGGGNAEQLNAVLSGDITIKKNGYAYIYVTNESTNWGNVFFDNLSVTLTHGALLEENHYNAWGGILKMISSSAAVNDISNKYKYNGKQAQNNEFGDGSGLEFLDYGARMYDVQLGRWNVQDILAEGYTNFSPYIFVANNPIRLVDIKGMFIYEGNAEEKTVLKMIAQNLKAKINSWEDDSQELKALLQATGFEKKEDLLKMFDDNQGPTLAFTEGYLENAGDGMIFNKGDGAGGFASNSVFGNYQNGKIKISRLFFDVMSAFSKYMEGDESNLISSSTSGLKRFDVKKDLAMASDFINQVLEHEIVHYGSEQNKKDKTVTPYAGNESGEKGQWYTDKAYGRRISWDCPEVGIAVFATFRHFAFTQQNYNDKDSGKPFKERTDAIINWISCHFENYK